MRCHEKQPRRLQDPCAGKKQSEATAAPPDTLWVSQNEHVVSFHAVEGDGYEPLVFANEDKKMEFVFQKCSIGFRVQ